MSTPSQNKRFHAIFVGLFALVFIPGMYYRRKAEQRESVSWDEEGKPIMITLRLAGLSMWLSVFTYIFKPQWMRWSSFPLPNWGRWFGVGLSTLMVGAIPWVFRSIGTNITQTVAIKTDHQLITHGPYRWIRHPLYTFGMTFFMGLGLIAANWFLLGATFVGMIMLLIRLPKEEANLIKTFGNEYRKYMKETGALLPKFPVWRR